MNNVPVVTILLEGVDSLTFRFLQDNGDWLDQWPPPAAGVSDGGSRLPRAVEITLMLPDEGELTRIVEVAP